MPEVMKTKDDSKPWKGVCVKRCWYALHDTCKCRCKKLNHGKGLLEKHENKNETLACPKCNSKFVIAKSQRLAPEGKIAMECGICSNGFYLSKTL